ncbi:MAG: RNA-binding cell elongation regulator Jag/EloR [SAR202 cluster bacterium]|jgi:spoIIIJ-associated protein|nr:RNA-binding cell elongation regulator Jag/EloR [SAR202 cluster bacterium]
MQVIETTAKTKEEAIEIALKELGAERGEVEINVVSLGKTGILGIGSEPARVRVTMLEETPDMVRVAGEVLNNLISKMGVSVVTNLKQAEREDEGGPAFDIEGEDSGLLIGRRGETLRALQFLVKVIVGRRMQTKANLSVDVEGYQERRYQALRNLAQRVGQRVVSSGRSVTLEPMPPDERRIVHMTLAEYSGVTSESMGDGDSRQVVVMLDEQ